MRKINKLSDLKAKEYFDTLTFINKMNNKELSAKEGISKIIDSFGGSKKSSAKEVEQFIGSIIEIIQRQESGEFNKIIQIKGINFGFEPSFETMESGAYQDLQEYLNNEQYLEALAILYRPISETYGNVRYSITSYVDESNNSFEYRVHLLGTYLGAEDAKGVIDFFVDSLLTLMNE